MDGPKNAISISMPDLGSVNVGLDLEIAMWGIECFEQVGQHCLRIKLIAAHMSLASIETS